MKTKILILFLFTFLNFNSISLAAGGSSGNSGNNDGKKMSDFDWGERKIIKAKKYEKKGKTKKAEKNYKEAIKYFFKANKKDSVNPDIYNYLGFAHRKIGNFTDGEMYYLIGLELDPKHNGINEYLGELYLQTDRKDKALERLKVLETCGCEEYKELKDLIEGKKTSKY
tara:strand:- start:99 stop:605 length:507 start_codon:yes stop_codon:yes gene_type:complete